MLFFNCVFATFSSQYLGEEGLHHSVQILCQPQPLRYLKASGTWRKNMHISRGKLGINFSTSLFVWSKAPEGTEILRVQWPPEYKHPLCRWRTFRVSSNCSRSLGDSRSVCPASRSPNDCLVPTTRPAVHQPVAATVTVKWNTFWSFFRCSRRRGD